MEITVYGPSRGLHSGHYGNWAPNPAMRLAELLASMKDERGNVTIAGFYDDVVPPTAAERQAIERLPDYDAALREELAFAVPEGDGESLTERMFIPSLNVRGLAAGAVGSQSANVVPESATASIDIRLPPGHDGNVMLDRVEAHIVKLGYHVVSEAASREERLSHDRVALVSKHPSYTGARTDVGSAAGQVLLDAASVAADGPVVAMPTLGGSVPIVRFNEILGTQTVIVPLANHDNNQHDANENLRLGNLWYGIDLMAAVLGADYASVTR